MDIQPSTAVGVRALRADLAATVRRAAAGQATVVTLAGRPAARLGPLDAADLAPLPLLVASGAVLAPRRTSTWRPPTPIAVWSGARLDRVLRDVR